MSGLFFQPEKMHVLIVDDHELIRKSIIKVLTKMRIGRFSEATNAHDAKTILDSDPVDLVLCDIYLTKSKGFEILMHVRGGDTRSDIPFIVVTGEASKDDIVKAADMGAEDYILKPFQAVDLEKKVTTLLNRYFNPTLLNANLRLAEKHLLEGNTPEAQAALAAASKLDPKSAQVRHLAAIFKAQAGDREAAIAILRESVTNNPSYLKNYRTLANLLLEAGREDEAAEAMRNELELNPKQPARQIALAKILQKKGNLMGAAEHLRQALLEDSRLKAALFGMGRVQAEMGNLEKAIYYFKRVRRYHPKNTRALEAIVQSAVAAQNPRLAEMTLKDEKKQFPKRLDTYVVLAKFFAMSERIEEALTCVGEALSGDAAFAEGHKIKGALLRKLGKLDEALESYKNAIQLDPEMESYFQVADILIEKKAFLEASQVLHAAMRSGQQVPRTLGLLTLATFQSKQITKAYFLAQRLLSLGVQSPQLQEIAQKTRALILSRRRNPTTLAS